MAKIPFTLEAWLKDKSQKVETRDGRIVHNIWPVKNKTTIKAHQTEVCALIDGEEDALVFFAGGKYLPVNAENPFDLFIVTPEEELTPFEQSLKDKFFFGELAIEESEIKEIASELLSLAREQFVKDGYVIEKKIFHDAVKRVDLGIMKEVSKNVDMQIALRTEYEKGRADTLKDLPRWWKCNQLSTGQTTVVIGYTKDEDALYRNGRVISLLDLEKLPGFKEDEQ